jgi:signal transduction histidine kinase
MRIRLVFAMLVVVVVTVLSMGGFAAIASSREVTRYVSRGGMMGLNDLVSSLEAYYQQFGTWQGAEILLTAHMGMGGQNRMGMGAGSQANDAPIHLILSDGSGMILVDTLPQDNRVKLTRLELFRAIPLNQRDGKVIGYLYSENLSTFQPELLRPLIQRLNAAAVRAGLIGGGIALLLALLLGYWFMKPVMALSKAASALGKGDLSQRVPVSGGDELARLGKTFNDMGASLQQAEQSRKNMTADIAHELRTPLSIQRAAVEAMLDGVYPVNRETLEPLLEQNILLTRLVDDLRLLALADAGELPLEMVETDLAGIVERVAGQFQSRADQEGIAIQFTRKAEIPRTLADPIRIEQILTNLIGNALKFTPLGGKVSVDVSGSSDGIDITITDSGPGIPADSLPFIFDRFYRVDQSRNREEGGSGLGLAIARQLARAQGGDITARNRTEGGAVFTLHMPVMQEQG